MNSENAVQALLRPVEASRTHWVFAFRPDDVWEPGGIGKRVAVNTENRAPIDTGVHKFLSLTVAGKPQLAAECA